MQLFGFHGLYPEEQVLGNRFILQVEVGMHDKEIKVLSDSIDYAEVLRIIQEEFKVATPLLETLLQRIEISLHKQFQHQMTSLKMSIAKLHPPLSASVSSSEVVLEKVYVV